MALLIDIEGIDGAGKGTQARLLLNRLGDQGLSASLLSFPRYGQTVFGAAVGEFLNGEYGSLDQVHPFLVSLLFAGDRAESAPCLREALSAHDVVVLDRYVPSNMAHQGAKLEGEEGRELVRRIAQIEYAVFGLPRPDLVVLLDMPAVASQALIASKPTRSYTDRAADLQEADALYLARVRSMYLELALEYDWVVVPGVDGGRIRARDEVADEIWSRVRTACADRLNK